MDCGAVSNESLALPGRPLQHFSWYEALPDGIERKICDCDDSRHSVSFYLHGLPVRTDTILDCSEDPVISMALNPAGVIEREVDGRWERAQLAPDNLTLTPARTECRWRWNGEPLDILDIYIPRELIEHVSQEHFRGNAVEANFVPRLVLRERSISLLIHSMLAALPLQGPHARFVRETMTLCLIGSLLALGHDAVSVQALARSKLSRAVLRRIETFVDENIESEISLQELADIACLSRYHFLRLFRQSVGVTPGSFVTRRRIERACLLLRETSLPITEVAARCGYGESSYFAASFRKWKGASPREFRQLQS